MNVLRPLKKKSWKKDYGRQCLKLPVLIHKCGLCQTLSFFKAKYAEKPDKAYYNQLMIDIKQAMGITGDALHDIALQADFAEYQWMTREALACADWFKRYAEAILKVEPGDDSGEK